MQQQRTSTGGGGGIYIYIYRERERERELFALETNRDHSDAFEIASKYCISDSFVDHGGYSISSEGFLPTVVDIMII